MYQRTQKETDALLMMQAAIRLSCLPAKAVVWNETHRLSDAMSESIDVYIQIESQLITINRLFDAEYVLRRGDAVLASDLVGAVADFTQQQTLL